MSAVEETGLVAFARRNRRVLGFGALHAFFSAPGQTICIGLFLVSFSESFGLSVSEIGGLYLLATIASAATLLAVGHLIDRVDLRTYSSISIAALALACALTATATHPLMLGLGLYALRLTGQGLMVHIEATATARAFTTDRGRALGLTALGIPLADALVPSLVIVAIAALGWRWTYGAIGLVLLFAVLPAARALATRAAAAPDTASAPRGSSGPRLWTGLSLLARSRFVWAALPALAISPLIGTALLFSASAVAARRGWPPEIVAASFSAMAAVNVAALFLAGWLIDRFSARAVFVIYPAPILLGLVVLAQVESAWALPAAMMLVGLSGAFIKTTVTAIWAELFGLANLGAMRSFAAMYSVFASALGPFAYGLMSDAGWSVSEIMGGFALGGVLAALPVALVELRRHAARWR